MTELLLIFWRGSRPACNGALIRENISCSRFLTNRNIFYDISLSHKENHELVFVSIGRKVPHSADFARVYSCSDTINSSQVFDKGKFEKMGFW